MTFTISPGVSEEQQKSLEEAEARWRDSVERCEKLKQAYGNLRQEHINLIRSHAETRKSLESQEQLLTDITQQLESKNTGSSQQLRNLEIQVLKLESDKSEAQRKFEAVQREWETFQVQNAEVKHENSSLVSNVEQLRQQAKEAGRLADKLKFDLDRAEKDKTNLMHKAEMQRADLNVKHEKEKQSIQRETLSKGEVECFLASVAHIKNHQNKNLYILNKADCAQTCSLEECTAVTDNCHNIVKNVVMNQRWSVLRAADKLSDLQQISQEFTQVAMCIRAAMGSLASDKADLLHRQTEDLITSFVTALESLTVEDSLSGLVEGRTQQLCAALHDVAKLCAKEETSMDNIVDQEMAATTAAINEAAAKIQEIQNATRQRYTGLELEVGEKILGSCTELMACVRELILSSAELQREIVQSGQVGGTATDYYKRHSRWTEGLLSAAKAVGWGASTLVSTADDVVSGTGKFEQLEVTSHEIAASTAQLVAASRVKADKDSRNFIKVMGTSKSVANATASVVAASKQCMKMTEESKLVAVDYSQLSAVQVKRLDMEMQVKILELENELTEERRRLTAMRKMHYHGDGTTNGGS
ncbi:huntingtin-interacting protein 1-like [Bolinopsis microptera]|uniref:huntingtin-interacting protein 1-like n=1 Tax=Bolinopsis microptera TaxID=2820187 RepID=UPI003079CB8A